MTAQEISIPLVSFSSEMRRKVMDLIQSRQRISGSQQTMSPASYRIFPATGVVDALTVSLPIVSAESTKDDDADG